MDIDDSDGDMHSEKWELMTDVVKARSEMSKADREVGILRSQ